MTSHRMDKVNELVREEVGRILLTESQDPRFVSVTVTGAKVSPDLHYARVFVSVLGSKKDRESIMKALAKAAGHVRHVLGQNVRMKFTPQLEFIYDETLETANRIYKKLERLNLEEEGKKDLDEEEDLELPDDEDLDEDDLEDEDLDDDDLDDDDFDLDDESEDDFEDEEFDDDFDDDNEFSDDEDNPEKE